MKKGFLEGYKTYDTTDGFGNKAQWKQAFKQRMTSQEAQEILAKQEQTPRQILGVSANASKQEIKAAFRKLVMQWHPDRNQHRLAEAEEHTKRIIAAYSVLTA